MTKYAAVIALAGFLSAGSLLTAKTVTVTLKDAKGQVMNKYASEMQRYQRRNG